MTEAIMSKNEINDGIYFSEAKTNGDFSIDLSMD